MADFAEGITDERAGRRLGQAIDGKGAFRDARAERRAVEWPADNELIREDEAGRYLASHPDPGMP